MATSDSDWTDNPNVQSWLAAASSQDDMPTTPQPTTTLRPYPSTTFDETADSHSDRQQWDGNEVHDAMGDELRVTVVATGLGKNKASISLVQPQQVLRTGTYNAPVMGATNVPATGMGQIAPGVEGLKQPAVWRREQASEQVQAMQRNGVETYDIPAFLRKQAD